MDHTATDAPPIRRVRPAYVVATLANAQLMLVLDVTVVNVALPDIGSELGLDRSAVTWVMTLYTTLFGGLALAGGKAADRLGARRVLAAGLALFVAASLLCALAAGPAVLLTGRALQGAAAALVSPAALAVLLGSVPSGARGRALAVWGTLSAVGTALGVSAGGIVTAALGWEWIFAINVPIGLAVLALLPVLTRAVPGTAARPDLPGTALLTLGTALLVLGVVRAGDDGWTSVGALGPVVGGIALWLAYAAVERVTPEPMLRLSLLRDPPVAAGAFLMIVATGLMVGNFFVGSFTLQRAYGDGPLRVGLEFLAPAVGVGLGAQLAGRLLDRVSPRVVAVPGLLLAGAGEGLAAVVDGSRLALVVGLAVAAVGIGAVFVTAFRSALSSAGPTDGGLRSAVVGTAHELGGAFGVAALSTVAAVALTAAHPVASDFTPAYAWAALAALASAAVAAVLVPARR
ncbi:MFS transporter [Luteipulveratus halotolerans]|uniref:Major facilitator superfamily (MFS) profile domain-containing protein n=1 Tax=Luteipulveratus halotolerans TaxID=1631356 RepID=A0A0L6CM13_9MICO|nr:MFS transporter [Luteipulveratus halotolerans]KNX38675.1 hypothetical protein VV01_18430 [Luteipulveratus halotolerans]